MRTIDERRIAASPELVFDAAADVERWPAILSHYRWVRVRERGMAGAERRGGSGGGSGGGGGKEADGDGGYAIVEMAAWRPFGPLNYPTWWVSEMRIDRAARRIRYRHVEGITRGMHVEWRVEPAGAGADVTIVHEWDGPPWPIIGRPAADWVIGPVFVHGIASRTLAGIAAAVTASDAPPASAPRGSRR